MGGEIKSITAMLTRAHESGKSKHLQVIRLEKAGTGHTQSRLGSCKHTWFAYGQLGGKKYILNQSHDAIVFTELQPRVQKLSIGLYIIFLLMVIILAQVCSSLIYIKRQG